MVYMYERMDAIETYQTHREIATLTSSRLEDALVRFAKVDSRVLYSL